MIIRTPTSEVLSNGPAYVDYLLPHCLPKNMDKRDLPLNLLKNGARGRIRTADTAIFNRMLYQLSYPGIGPRRR